MTRPDITPEQARRALERIAHPKWTPDEDRRILKMRERGMALDMVAQRLCRPSRLVEQRWHRLRGVPRIALALDYWLQLGGDAHLPWPGVGVLHG